MNDNYGEFKKVRHLDYGCDFNNGAFYRHVTIYPNLQEVTVGCSIDGVFATGDADHVISVLKSAIEVIKDARKEYENER